MISPRPPLVSRWGALILFLAVSWTPSCGTDGVTVYGAASLTNALEEAARVFQDQTGTPVYIRTEGSGVLSLEIQNGAPADIFIPAAEEWMAPLITQGLVDSTTRKLVGWNRLVLVVPNSAVASAPRGFQNLNILDKIAMGDPESVPAGRYTSQALTTEGFWLPIQDRLILTHSVRAALALVEQREVEGAFVYASDAAVSDRVNVAFDLPEQSHDPVVYVGAVLRNAPHAEAAQRFLDFLTNAEGKRILRSHHLGGS